MKIKIGIQIYRQAMVDIFRKYNASDTWQRVREAVIKQSKGRCEDCYEQIKKWGTVHHLSYDNWGKGNIREVMSCVYLCKKCHQKRHNRLKQEIPFWAKIDPECWGELEITIPIEEKVCL